jgi:hypothetical protein
MFLSLRMKQYSANYTISWTLRTIGEALDIISLSPPWRPPKFPQGRQNPIISSL